MGCQKARIKPDFSELADKKAIILKCALKNTTFLHAEGKNKNVDGFPELFGGKLPALLDRLSNVLFNTIDTELLIFGETLEFRSFEARAKDIKLSASGSVEENGNIGLSLKILFSPEIVATLPEELKTILTPEETGWFSYHIKLESSRARPFLKLETDRFRLEFKEIQKH